MKVVEETDKIQELFRKELKVINIGLEIFFEALKQQGIKAVQVNWQPPPKIEKEYEDILDKIL